ncbi:E1 [Macaca mulatta papillomavirus 7]|uniref:E1 n=1 Tax=Macaca mulatta papillomavirus 7 TaxID=2364644 RepID=UPI000EB7661D|nr:E1 [Macaca mulatta papillomavirus 7]AYD74614.1 E1 [Macaca mulatta papillomavirus 7]
MGDPNKGTDSVESLDSNNGWYIVQEAECVDDLNALDDLFEESTDGSMISNLIDDIAEDAVDEGNTLALFNTQITEECDKAIQALKRKLIKSPQHSIAELSPKLQAVSITPKKNSKRRLQFEDSGIVDDEAENTVEKVAQVPIQVVAGKDGGYVNLELLQVNNRKSIMLAKFKDCFGVSFTELSRNFKSDRSCSENWVVYVYKAANETLEGSKIVLQQYCEFMQVIIHDFSGLYLLKFKSTKNRDTVSKLFSNMLNVQDFQIICEPPRNRSVAAALYFYKKSLLNTSYTYGQMPEWVAKLTIVDHQAASAAETFQLSVMVQWAFDNEIYDESEIAYKYALMADEDPNAAAFLNSNCQVKYVRDCSQMVKLYKRQEMKEMTNAEWIDKCCERCKKDGSWKPIALFLKHQNIPFVSFLITLKTWVKGLPKKNCLVIYGEPDTGKSYFAFSFLHFVRGKVISYMNRTSPFWLMPLQDTKFGLMDDATYSAWQYIDQNMRNALDGNYMCLDSKHKAPAQIKLPPLMITTNLNVLQETSLLYLHSRIMCLEFPNKMPFNDDGTPVFQITDETWKCFFRKFGRQLELAPAEEEGDGDAGDTDRTFRCTARTNNDSL